jgi:adenosylcobinamide amidohydrolase
LEEEDVVVFVHARKGAVYNIPKQEKRRYGWGNDRVTYWDDYDLKKYLPSLLRTLKVQEIDVVLFNEEYDWELVKAIKEEGFRVVAYLDYLHNSWLKEPSPLLLYDAIFFSTIRCYWLV